MSKTTKIAQVRFAIDFEGSGDDNLAVESVFRNGQHLIDFAIHGEHGGPFVSLCKDAIAVLLVALQAWLDFVDGIDDTGRLHERTTDRAKIRQNMG